MNGCIRIRLAAILLAMTAGVQQSHADVVVIVSANSSAVTMTAAEISEIYLGKSKAMKPVDTTASPMRTQFYTKVASKDEAQVRAIWSRLIFTGKATPPKELASSAEVVKAVAADPAAIGYIDKSAVDATVKVVYELK